MKMETKGDILELELKNTPLRLIANPKEPHMTIVVRDGAYEVAYGEHMLRFHKGQMHFLTGDPDD
jgi:hypothetical protein